jgi:hypothetical protein
LTIVARGRAIVGTASIERERRSSSGALDRGVLLPARAVDRGVVDERLTASPVRSTNRGWP